MKLTPKQIRDIEKMNTLKDNGDHSILGAAPRFGEEPCIFEGLFLGVFPGGRSAYEVHFHGRSADERNAGEVFALEWDALQHGADTDQHGKPRFDVIVVSLYLDQRTSNGSFHRPCVAQVTFEGCSIGEASEAFMLGDLWDIDRASCEPVGVWDAEALEQHRDTRRFKR